MYELKCKNCGAPMVNIGLHYKCEYCGSMYKAESFGDHVQVVEVRQAQAVVLAAEQHVDRALMGLIPEEDLSKITLQELTHKLAEGLSAYLRLDVREDPLLRATIVRGTVRVIPPDSRF